MSIGEEWKRQNNLINKLVLLVLLTDISRKLESIAFIAI